MATAKKPARKNNKASAATKSKKKAVLDYDALIKPGSFLDSCGGMVPTVSLGKYASIGVLPPALMKKAPREKKKVAKAAAAEGKGRLDYDALMKPGSFMERCGGMVPTVSLGKYASIGVLPPELWKKAPGKRKGASKAAQSI